MPAPADDDPELTREVVPSSSGALSDHDRFDAGARIANRYRIVARLGAGGMGEVYRADDLRLGQPVALKFLPPATRGDQRLIDLLTAEVRVGRLISHPHVCRLFDLVEADDLLFISMEYVDGEDLSRLLKKVGRLAPDLALRLVREMALGLAAAHDLGIIHRDLKPANVMIDTRGGTRIMDFGLAMPRDEPQGGGLTGTPAYMAPEQLGGGTATVRSDLYALGVLGLELVTGRRLYDGSTLGEIAVQHRERKPVLTDDVVSVDAAFAQILMACVAENPAERPSSAHDVVRALPGAEARSTSSDRRDSTRGSAAEARSIAVLPFESLTRDDDESFALGLAEEVLSDLARLGSLRVISRPSAMRFRGTKDLPAAARELHVRYLLTGSVRTHGGRLRVTVNLIDAPQDMLVWAERFDGTTADLFDIQETVARAVATRIKGELTPEEDTAIATRTIADPLAFEYYLKARSEIWRFTREGLDRALELLHRGAELIGENILLNAAMANVHWQYINAGFSSDVRHLEKADELGRRVAAADPQSAHGPRILGLVAISRGDVRGAVAHLRRAVALDANDPETLTWSSVIYCFAGLSDLAFPLTRRLKQIDPANALGHSAECLGQWMQGRWTEAAAGTEKALTLDAQSAMVWWFHVYALVMDHRDREAREAAAQAERRHPDAFTTSLVRLLLRAIDGDRAGVEAVMTAQFHTAAWNDLQYAMHVAEAYAQLGEPDRAFEWLANAIVRGFTDAAFLGTHDWLLAPLRGDARFDALLADARERSEALRRELGAASAA